MSRRNKRPEPAAVSATGPREKPEGRGRYPAIERGLVRIFGRPWGGSKEFMPDPTPREEPPPNRSKKDRPS